MREKKFQNFVDFDFDCGSCGFWVMAARKLAPDRIKNGKIKIYQLWIQFIYYIKLWGQALVVIVIARVDIFQKIIISEYHFVARLKIIA